MPFLGFREQSHNSDARLWHPARGMPDEGIASSAEPARQRSTMHPRSLILGLAVVSAQVVYNGELITGGYFFTTADGQISAFWARWKSYPRGDCDCDSHVNLGDFADFPGCMSGPGGSLGMNCGCLDLHVDGTVDLADFARFQTSLSPN